MLKHILLYEIRGRGDEPQYVVVDEPADTACVQAHAQDGSFQHFESEAYHLGVWGDQHGISISLRELVVDTGDLFQPESRDKRIYLAPERIA